MNAPSPSSPNLARLGLVLALLAVAGVVWTHLDLAGLERRIAIFGPWAPLVFLLAFVLVTPALVPDSPFAAVAGALFGLFWGTLLTTLGAFLSAALTFAISRWLLRDWLQGVLARHPRLHAVEGVVSQGQRRLLILLRVVPLNPATVNYLLAATRISFGRYLLSCFGLIPAHFAAVYVGWMVRLTGGRAQPLGAVDYAAAAGFVVTILALVLATRAAHRAIADLERPPSAPPPA